MYARYLRSFTKRYGEWSQYQSTCNILSSFEGLHCYAQKILTTNSLASTFISPSPPPRPLSQTSAGGDKQLVCPMGVEHSHKVERGDKQVVCPRGTNIYIH